MTRHQISDGAIDTHAHVYPAEYLDLLERIGVSPDSTAIARGIGADLTTEDITRRLADMDAAGVATQVLAVTPQAPSAPSPADSLRAARWINNAYAELVAEHPGRFLAYMALPLPHIEESLREYERMKDAPGFVGVSLSTVLSGAFILADPSLEPLWEALNADSAVVNVHPTGSGALSPLIADHGLEWVNGAPVEDATSVLHLMKADVPGRYPNIRFHIAHLGGDLPFLAQRIEDNYTDWHAFAHRPRETWRSMYFDAANFFEPALALAAEVYGASQILSGSDMPYFQADKYVRAFDYVRTSRLGELERAAILRGNAERLYGLTAGKE